MSPVETAKLHAATFAAWGAILGVFYAFGGLFVDITSERGVNWGTLLAFLALIGMPAMAALIGAVIGFVGQIFLQLFARNY